MSGEYGSAQRAAIDAGALADDRAGGREVFCIGLFKNVDRPLESLGRSVFSVVRTGNRGDAEPSNAIFRTNHASNYLPLAGRLPRDKERLVATIDSALAGEIPLRPEEWRGL